MDTQSISARPQIAAAPDAETTVEAPGRRSLRVLVFLEAGTIAGAVKPVLEFAQEARASDNPAIEIVLVVYRRHEENNVLMDAVRELGIAMEVIDERHAFDLRVPSQVRQLAERLRPDIVWTNNTKSHLLVCLSGLNRTAEWIAFHHGYTKEAWRTRFYNELDRISLPRARRVVTVCNDFAAQLRGKGVRADRLRVVRNPIRVLSPVAETEKRRMRTELGLKNDTVLLSVGRLSLEKGHADLIRALASMRTSRPGSVDWRLLIVGDGPERRNLQALCSELHMDDVVQFTGFKADVRPYYAIADICILPSHSEGSPNVLLEAMAAGLPVIATAVGGLPEVLTNEVNALLVAGGNIGELSAGIARLLHEPLLRQRLAEKGKELVAQHTPQSYFRGVVTLFNEVLGETSAT